MENAHTYSDKEAKKKIKRYICGKAGMISYILAWVFGILTLCSLMRCTVFICIGAALTAAQAAAALVDNIGSTWIGLAIIFGFYWFASAFVYRAVNRKAEMLLKALDESGGLVKAAMEMDSPESIVIGSKKGGLGIFSPSFVFGHGTGTVLRYEDIRWAYCKTESNQYATVSYISVSTPRNEDLGLIKFGLGGAKRYKQQTDNILDIIARRSPGVILGYTEDIEKYYREHIRQANGKRKK